MHRAAWGAPGCREQLPEDPFPVRALTVAGSPRRWYVYADLIVALQTARADGYQTVWFHQRLSLACARHGWDHLSEGTRVKRNGPGGLAVNEYAEALNPRRKAVVSAVPASPDRTGNDYATRRLVGLLGTRGWNRA
jgi:hypothetical protein